MAELTIDDAPLGDGYDAADFASWCGQIAFTPLRSRP